MNCVNCSTVLRDGARFCHECGAPQIQQADPTACGIPVITGNEWFAFVRNGNYTLKYKLNSNLQIVCGGRGVALLLHSDNGTGGGCRYDLVQNENDRSPVVCFVRGDNNLVCTNPVTGQVYFTWQRQSSSLGELASGSKWQCGTLSLGQSGMRSLAQWLPGIISWLVPTKYFVRDNGRDVGVVKGSCTSFSNSKSVEILAPSRAWELLAVAIILSNDELG